MKTPVGIDFTETAIHALETRGFSFTSREEAEGYRRFYCPLKDPSGQFSGFEIHVVEDEVAYLKKFRFEHFHPFIESTPFQMELENSNSADTFGSALRVDQINEDDVRTYFELRKGFPLCALHLKCRDFETFKRIARPDRYFTFQSQQAALIHLGPSCFDLLVSAR